MATLNPYQQMILQAQEDNLKKQVLFTPNYVLPNQVGTAANQANMQIPVSATSYTQQAQPVGLDSLGTSYFSKQAPAVGTSYDQSSGNTSAQAIGTSPSYIMSDVPYTPERPVNRSPAMESFIPYPDEITKAINNGDTLTPGQVKIASEIDQKNSEIAKSSNTPSAESPLRKYDQMLAKYQKQADANQAMQQQMANQKLLSAQSALGNYQAPMDLSPLYNYMDTMYGTKLAQGAPKTQDTLQQRIAMAQGAQQATTEAANVGEKNKLNAIQMQLNREKYLDQLKQRADEMKLREAMLGVKLGASPLDKKYSNQLLDWQTSGEANSLENLATINDVRQKLATGQIKTGKENTFASSGEGFLRSRFDPEGLAAQQAINKLIVSTLKQTLGSQFTENEGRQLKALSYDPNLSNEENLKKLDKMESIMARIYDVNKQQEKYFMDKGTLKGFIPTKWDGKSSPVTSASSEPTGTTKAKSITQGGHTYTLNEKTGEYE